MSKKLLSFLLTICFGIIQAQNIDTTKTISLDEVVVTANKFPQKQSTTGKVISVITKDQIEKTPGKTISQLLNEQAGITINGALNNLGANQTIYLRGASSARTLVLLDGIPVYDPSYINNEFDLNLLSLNNVERIEICRGSQSTLYGSDAIAGVINIITTDGNLKKPLNLKVSGSAGNLGTYRANAQLFGKLNKCIYSVKYGKLTSKGFSAAYDSSGIKNFANNKYNGDVYSSSFQYLATENISFRSFIQNSRYKTDLDAGAFIDEKDNTVENKSLIAGIGMHYQKSNISLTANYQYNKNKRNYFNDSTDVPTFIKFATDNYTGETRFAEIFSSIAITKNITLLEGADYRFNSYHSAYNSLSSFGAYSSKFKDTSLSQSSLYSSILFHCDSDKINIEIGGRLNVHSRYGSNSSYTFNPSFKITDHIKLFGSVETGFKAPSLFQLYAGGGTGNRSLKPETSKTYEAGIEGRSKSFLARADYFHRDVKDGLDFDYNHFTYYNFNKQTVYGFEFELHIKPLKGLDINTNYTYLKPSESVQSRITASDTTYAYVLRRPANNFNISIGYQFEGPLYLSLSGKYVGKRYDVGEYKHPDVLLSNYFIINGYAEYKFNSFLKIFVDAQNITDKKFFDIRGYNSIPFLFNAGVSFTL